MKSPLCEGKPTHILRGKDGFCDLPVSYGLRGMKSTFTDPVNEHSVEELVS